MSFKTFLTEAANEVWLYGTYLGDDDDLAMESLTVFASEKAVVRAMIEEVQEAFEHSSDADEDEEKELLKALKKLKTIDEVKDFISENREHLGPIGDDDCIRVHKTTIRR